MEEKLQLLENRYEEIEKILSSGEIYENPAESAKLLKEQKDLSEIVENFRKLKTATKTRDESLQMMEGHLEPDFREMVQEEIDAAKAEIAEVREKLKVLLLPKDKNDDKNVIMEIRSGVGGEEACLFANSLYRMYSMYAEAHRWKVDVMNINETELGGIKEICLNIEGNGAYSRLKFESGAHRVQRVPETEASGRVHTSAVTVAVLPEVEDVEIEINPNDLQIDTFRSSGAGGQHVNKTESAIRITHFPTGLVVECQDERSQHKNKDRAMKILRSRLYEMKQQEQNDEIAEQRRSQVGTGDRSERIRTYNYPQGRVSDHRINLTLYKLEQFMNGDLDEMIDALISADQAAKLANTEGIKA